MGHVTRLEQRERDDNFKGAKAEVDRIVAQTEALMARLVALYNSPASDASDKSDIVALRQKLIDDLTAAVTI